MANKVTGSTDTTGALSTAPTMSKSVLLVAKLTGTPVKTAEYNKVFSITSTSDAADRFGADSPMVKAVKVAVQNNTDTFYGVIVDSTLAEGDKLSDKYADALEASLGEKSVKCIILDDYSDNIMAEVKTHLSMAEANDLFRYCIVASDDDDNDAMILAAKEYNNSRIFLVGPTFVSGGEKVSRILVAAAMTGVTMTESDDPALPMNGVEINGIGNVNRTVLEADRKLLASNGVTAIYNNGSPTIYRYVTTYTTDAIWQEVTTRFIADYVLEHVEETLRANYKRTKNVVRILKAIRTTVKGLLETYEGLEIIENFDEKTLTVIKDPEDIYGALVDYEFDVVTPLYTITINQHMKL